LSRATTLLALYLLSTNYMMTIKCAHHSTNNITDQPFVAAVFDADVGEVWAHNVHHCIFRCMLRHKQLGSSFHSFLATTAQP